MNKCWGGQQYYSTIYRCWGVAPKCHGSSKLDTLKATNLIEINIFLVIEFLYYQKAQTEQVVEHDIPLFIDQQRMKCLLGFLGFQLTRLPLLAVFF